MLEQHVYNLPSKTDRITKFQFFQMRFLNSQVFKVLPKNQSLKISEKKVLIVMFSFTHCAKTMNQNKSGLVGINRVTSSLTLFSLSVLFCWTMIPFPFFFCFFCYFSLVKSGLSSCEKAALHKNEQKNEKTRWCFYEEKRKNAKHVLYLLYNWGQKV